MPLPEFVGHRAGCVGGGGVKDVRRRTYRRMVDWACVQSLLAVENRRVAYGRCPGARAG
jgi:hypothetical protein